MGIRGPALSLLRSYLTNRSQVVKINDSLSQPLSINKGVPQGSILGPILFLIYINDLPECLRFSNCLLYADDTTIYAYNKSANVIVDQLNYDLSNLSHWCAENKLCINPTKTHFVIFHSQLRTIELTSPLRLQNHVIHPSSDVMFLGLLLDQHLKFNLHTKLLSKKIGFGLRVLIKSRHYFPRYIMISLYHAFIHSHLQYCVSTWGNTYATHLAHVQHLQTQALRLITFSSFMAHAKPIFHSLNILPVINIFQQKVTTVIYRARAQEIFIDSLTATALLNYNNTRFSENNNVLLPKAKTNYGQFTAYFMGISIWNRLPNHIKSSRTSTQFSRRVKQYFITLLLQTDG